jgi:histidinol dehydrogenase
LGALEFSRAAIERFALAQLQSLRTFEYRSHGLRIRQNIFSIKRIGAYVPGGRYPLPSSALMCAVPARVAGVRDVIACTPNPAPETLAALHISGASRVFVAGGPQAIAAMAYGTESIPKVDKIVGPGNAFVAEAKRLVFGACGIDALAGPSELLVVASSDADPRLVAADLLAQAEHDVAARIFLVTDSVALASEVNDELERQLAVLPSADVAADSLRAGSAIIAPTLDDAVVFTEEVAPEHVQLHGARAESLVGRFTRYGSLFVGAAAAEVFGDYASGPNHVLPTGGAARFSGGLSVMHFVCPRVCQTAVGAISTDLINATAELASREGLEAHRRAALARLARLP